MFIITYRKYFYAVSLTLITASIICVGVWGIRLGIDYTGGSEIELAFKGERPSVDFISKMFYDSGVASVSIRGIGERGMLVRFRDISQTEHELLLKKFSGNGADAVNAISEKRFTAIGPLVGNELKQGSIKALGLVLVSIMLYIAWVFRSVSAPVSSWKYGVIAIIALLHDVIIPLGVFVVLGRIMGIEIDVLFITAILTVLGFSVHDTIVVFDRIREKLISVKGKGSFEDLVGASVDETIMRSINTSLVTVIALFAVYIFGGETTRYFSLLLIIGIITGTYSSVCIASPLLVTWEKFQQRKRS